MKKMKCSYDMDEDKFSLLSSVWAINVTSFLLFCFSSSVCFASSTFMVMYESAIEGHIRVLRNLFSAFLNMSKNNIIDYI